MFTLTQAYNGKTLPVTELYVDSLNTLYQFDEITIQATQTEETLDISGSGITAHFKGTAFPLSGADFLTAQTGTLTVLVTQALATGIHLFPFVSQHPIFPGVGCALAGGIGYGAQHTLVTTLNCALQVQSLKISGVELSTTSTLTTVPTAYSWR